MSYLRLYDLAEAVEAILINTLIKRTLDPACVTNTYATLSLIRPTCANSAIGQHLYSVLLTSVKN